MEYDIASLIEDDSASVNWHLASGRERAARSYRRIGRRSLAPKAKGGAHATLLDLPICAIDGEGKTRPNGRHDYTLLSAMWPTGKRCIEGSKLSLEQCLDFILDLPDQHVYLGYGLSYDTNMWLLDMPNDAVDELLDTGQTRYKQYSIDWVERKYMTIRAYGKSRTVYDVLAFFQVPFVSPDPAIVKGACDAWLPQFAADLDFVRLMKGLRGNFQNVPDDEIQRYTYIECDLLGQLMRKFIDALKASQLRPRALYGPGALAAAALEKYRVKQHMAPLPDALQTLARTAYFGGRFDAAVFGWLEDCYQYDIRSAYPHQIRSLPCLKCATFAYRGTSYDVLMPRDYGLYHVEWRVDPDARWGPFPHRTPQGLIYYPYEGAGWYHASEVTAALTMFGSDAIKVVEGWDLVRSCDHVPFDFVVSLYALRKELESSGNVDQGIVIKLLLNSLYGKLAQQVGRRKNQAPPFQCFFWAGAITAGTRAQILDILTTDADNVISIATDGIVATEELDLLLSEELGDWECKPLTTFAQLSNGVYHAVDTKGKHIDRARGLGRGVLDFSKTGTLYKHWKKTRGMGTELTAYRYMAKPRFVTLREARNRLDRNAVKCRWLTEERSLNLAPQRRFPMPDSRLFRQDRLGTHLYSYADYGAERESQPFRIKTDSAEVHALRDQYHGTAWYASA